MLARWLNLRPGEGRVVFLLGLLLCGNAFALEVSEVVSTSGFLTSTDVVGILLVWVVGMCLIVLSATLQSLVIDRFDRIRFISWMCLLLAGFYWLLRLSFFTAIPPELSYGLLSLLGDQQWFFFPLVFWVLANDIFELAQGERIFPLLIGVGFLGQVGGILAAAAAPTLLPTLGLASEDLLTINALIMTLLFFLVVFALAGVPIDNPNYRPQQLGKTLTEGWRFVRNVPSFFYMSLIYLGVAVALTIVRFQFLVISDAQIPDDQYQTFYGLYRLILVSGILFTTTFLSSRITRNLELKNVFFIYPLTLLAVLLSVLFLPVLVISTGGIIATWLVYYTVNQSGRKSFQSLIPEERRGRVSVFMDSYVAAVGVIIGAVITGALVLLGDAAGVDAMPFYLLVGLGAVGFAVWATLQMRRVYDTSLLNWRMRKRQHRSRVLEQLEDMP